MTKQVDLTVLKRHITRILAGQKSVTMSEKEFESEKKMIRSVLLPFQSGCSIREFQMEYKKLIGQDVPYKKFKYSNIVDFFMAMPDVVWMQGEILKAVADSSTQHIQKMVTRQKTTSKPGARRKPHQNYQPRFPPRLANYYANESSYYNKPWQQSRSQPYNQSRQQASSRESIKTTPSKEAYRPPSRSTARPYSNNQDDQFSCGSSNSNQRLASTTPAVSAANQRPTSSLSEGIHQYNQRNSSAPQSGHESSQQGYQRGASAHQPSQSNSQQNYYNTSSRPQTAYSSSQQDYSTASAPKVCYSSSQQDYSTASAPKVCYSSSQQDYSTASAPKVCYSSSQQDYQSTAGAPKICHSSSQQDYAPQVGQLSSQAASIRPTGTFPLAVQDNQPDYSRVSSLSPLGCAPADAGSPSRPYAAFLRPKPSSPNFAEASLQFSNTHLQTSSSQNPHLLDTLDDFPSVSTADISKCGLGMPDQLKKNLQKVRTRIISAYPSGIFATDFPDIYKFCVGHELDLQDLGYSDLSSFVAAFPDILHRKNLSGSRKEWLVVPSRDSPSPPGSGNEVYLERIILNTRNILTAYQPEGIRMQDFLHAYSINCNEALYVNDLHFDSIEHFLGAIADAVPLRIDNSSGQSIVFLKEPEPEPEPEVDFSSKCDSEKLDEQQLPKNVSLSTPAPPMHNLDELKYVGVYTSTVYTPSHLYLQMEENAAKMKELNIEMEKFYGGPRSREYAMREEHVRRGVACVALWPVDGLWYRAEILSIESPGTVVVSYFDYGTRDTVQVQLLRYLKSNFAKLPMQAVRASLAYIKPTKGRRWEKEATELILDICVDKALMCKLVNGEGSVVRVVLCDTSGEKDVFIQDMLVQKGLAEDEQAPLAPPPGLPAPTVPPMGSMDDPQVVMQYYLQAMASAWIASGQTPPGFPAGQSLFQPFANPLLPSSLSNPVVPPSPSNPVVSPPVPPPRKDSPTDNFVFDEDDDALFEEFLEKATIVSKRYVKRVHTSDGYTFHILIVDREPHVSDGDISKLIWSNKPDDYLKKRLENRELHLPFRMLSEEGNDAMFEQFKSFGVKGCISGRPASYMLVYALKSVVKILNEFGHPSAELRRTVRDELASFDPSHPSWQELSDAELSEKAMDGRRETDDAKLERICMYDLCFMRDSIRIKQRQLPPDSKEEEARRLHSLGEKIASRISTIQQICDKFAEDADSR